MAVLTSPLKDTAKIISPSGMGRKRTASNKKQSIAQVSNSIVSLKRNKNRRSTPELKKEFKSFERFIRAENQRVRMVKMPSKRKVKMLENITSNLSCGMPGRGGGLLGAAGLGLTGLGLGADLLGGLGGRRGRVRGYKPTFGQTLRSQRQVNNPGKNVSLNSSRRDIASRYARRYGDKAADARFLKGAQGAGRGLRGVPVLGALFTGLDFAEGVSSGESVGKAATGAVASTAGGLAGAKGGAALGAGIGSFIVPGVGTVVGGALGGLIGGLAGSFGAGYAADRAYEGVTGEKSPEQRKLDEAQKQKLKELAEKQKAARFSGDTGLAGSLKKFTESTLLFTTFVDKYAMSAGDIAPGTQTDNLGSRPPSSTASGSYPGFDNVERVAPFVTGQVSTYPGAQYGASRSGGRMHVGQDISGQEAGDPVLAAMAGTIVEVGAGFAFQRGNGTSQTIGIKHQDGSMTRYVHILSNVSVGAEVKAGQQIGTVSPADTASSPDFPHLHFEIYAPNGGPPLDPRPFLNSAPSSPSIAPISPGPSSNIGPTPQQANTGADDRESAPSLDPGNAGYDMTKTREGNLRTAIADEETGQTYGDLEDMRVRNERMDAMVKALGRDNDHLALAMDNLTGTASVEGYASMMRDKGMHEELESILRKHRAGQLIDSGRAAQYVDGIKTKMSSEALELLRGPTIEPKAMTPPSQGLSSYPEYNRTGQVAILPMISPPSPSSGGQTVMGPSGGGMQLIPVGPSQGAVVNSLMKKMLLTTLSQT